MSKPLVVLVFAESPEVARAWIAEQPTGPLYAYANRWSAFIGRDPSRTFFARVGEWWRHEANEEAFWWGKDRGFKEWPL